MHTLRNHPFRTALLCFFSLFLFTAGLYWLCAPNVLAQAQEKVVNAYNTMTGLQGANPNIANNVVVVQGLTTAGDGQGGVFAYDPNSSATTDTTNTFKPTNFNGRWLRQFGTSLRTECFTAVTAGDGTVTSTFPIAFSAAPIVVTTPVNNTTPTNTVVSATTSNCVIKLGANGVTLNGIALGAP